MSGDLRIGTSGWSYPTGKGKWDGVFYPPKRGRDKAFDELTFYAEHFNTVEINSTFYGQPRAEVSRTWVERTPAGFEFSVKLFQKFTHPRMYAERIRAQVPGGPSDRRRVQTADVDRPDREADAALGEAMVQALTRPTLADLDEFKRGIDPLARAGKMGALLAQFPPSFKNTEQEREYLTWLLEVFRQFPVAVELRHKSWSDAVAETLTLLNAFGAAWVQIDEPKFRLSIRQNYLPNIKGFYYLRLHGRNAAQWWHHSATEDRYNYLYSADELTEFSETIKATREIVKKTYVYTNNHFSAKSIANATMIKQQVGEPITGEYPESFVTAFPDLRDIVSTGRTADPAQRNSHARLFR